MDRLKDTSEELTLAFDDLKAVHGKVEAIPAGVGALRDVAPKVAEAVAAVQAAVKAVRDAKEAEGAVVAAAEAAAVPILEVDVKPPVPFEHKYGYTHILPVLGRGSEQFLVHDQARALVH